jgi:hypothetical protein
MFMPLSSPFMALTLTAASISAIQTPAVNARRSITKVTVKQRRDRFPTD